LLPPSSSPRDPQITLKTVFTVCFGILAVYGLAVFAIRTAVAIALSLAALVLAVALNHLVEQLVRRRMPRNWAIACVVSCAILLVVALGLSIIPPALAQARAFFEGIPLFIGSARSSSLFQALDNRIHIADRIVELERQAPRMLEGAAAPLLSVVGGVVTSIVTVITVLVLAVFMLIFGGKLVQAVLSEAMPENRPLYGKVLDKIYRSIGGYLGGLVLICTVNAVITTAFLAIMGIPFYLPLGIFSGSSSLIPYAGPAAAGALISITAAVTSSFWKGVGCAIYFLVYGQLEGNVLAPLIFRRTVHVNPLVVTLSILFFGELAGVFGAILAVPAAAATQIVLREVLRARRERLHLPPSPFDRPSSPTSSNPSASGPSSS
jgi:putative heme transporter